MKYILKKHSPDAKAGQIYHLGLKNAMCGHNNPHILYHDTDPHGKANFDIGGVDVSEWFEEVKPREYVVELVGKNEEPRVVCVHTMPKDSETYKYIKVREVEK